MKKPLLSANHIRFSIGEQEILRDVSFTLFSGEVLALVGPNGVGKSTLLRIIAGIQKPDGGSIERSKDATVAYLPQEIGAADLGLKVRDYCGDIGASDRASLGLRADIMDARVSDLSGGEKGKIGLLKIMKSASDVYILDEPTNNLDLGALKVLNDFIASRKGQASFIIVSHDRQLLEDLADKILEIDPYDRSGSMYPEKFSAYLLERKRKIENEWKGYNDYLAEKRLLERSLQEKKQWSQKGEKGPKKTDNEKMARGNSKDWSGKVLGRAVRTAEKRLAELVKVEKPREMPVLTYAIPLRERSGDMVFRIENAAKRFGNRTIGPISLDVQFGDRLVITGDNGTGKTTLLRMLTGRLAPDAGAVEKGAAVDIGYLPQESELKDEALLADIKKLDGDAETEFRKTLNNLGLTKEELKKGRGELSPGERSRFILASLIAHGPNCLILDEPTNHLDIYALDFLEEAIRTYPGTLVVVTHDRYFLGRIGNHRVFDMGKLSGIPSPR